MGAPAGMAEEGGATDWVQAALEHMSASKQKTFMRLEPILSRQIITVIYQDGPALISSRITRELTPARGLAGENACTTLQA
jgi:hypothetical protein